MTLAVVLTVEASVNWGCIIIYNYIMCVCACVCKLKSVYVIMCAVYPEVYIIRSL